MFMPALGLMITTLVLIVAGSLALPAAQPPSLTIFAAASMKNALDSVNAAFTRRTGIGTVASYAATSALMRQIEQGAPADVFASADLDWMEYGLKSKLIDSRTRINLLGNRLVLIAPKDSKIAAVMLVPGVDLAKLIGEGRIVTGQVKSVPAGRYAKAALDKLGLWPSVEKRMAMVENVRVALTLVARGEAALGLVYETDAKIEPGVRIVAHFPADSHPAITYPVAATMLAKPQAARYLDFLQSRAAKTVFEAFGFSFLIEPMS